jgi:hypothetical protein
MNMAQIKLLMAVLVLLSGIAGCDTPQQAAPDTKSRVTFGPHENEKEFGKYTVHVNALTTDQLPADVARSYKITRSKNRAMLNVVVMKTSDGVKKPTTASVTTLTRNLANQVKDMKMREIVEQDAIYYIGDIPVDNEESLIFNIDVTPAGDTSQLSMTYSKQFFTE